jgi:hypothetical protein
MAEGHRGRVFGEVAKPSSADSWDRSVSG